MTESAVIIKNGKPILSVNGKIIPAAAYITYFDERSCCGDFAKAGYELFSVCASFSDLPLNSDTSFSPFCGIFDVKGKPDYSLFDRNVKRITDVCPSAKIFPRVRISMPSWWTHEHPDECCKGADGIPREAIYSESFRETGAQMLREFISHVQTSIYADNIIGYQISGGYTEEWFHFDSKGSISQCTKDCFNKYLSSHFPGKYKTLSDIPSENTYSERGLINDELAANFLSFVNNSISETISFFAKTAKQCVNFKQIVGTFFGYIAEVTNPLRGSSGLGALLECPYIDFICSPNSYLSGRALGKDWSEMTAGQSIRLHGKLYFAENYIRTHLSDYPYNCRKGIDPEKKYSGAIWKGPDTVKGSVSALRKSFARQVTHANGMWWFDMWGGWYACPEIMNEMSVFLNFVKKYTESDSAVTSSQTALIADESYNRRVGLSEPSAAAFGKFRDCLGNTGMPYDILLDKDYRHCASYKAVILPYRDEYLSESSRLLKQFCAKNGVAVITSELPDASDINTQVLRDILISKNVHCYCTSDDVIYFGNGLLCIHAANAGQKTLKLMSACKITPLGDEKSTGFVSDTIKFTMEKYETRLFEIS